MFGFVFDKSLDVFGTSFKGYLATPYAFEETVARLYSLANYDIFSGCDHKSSFQISCKFRGNVFTLYDYKEDSLVHIGGHDDLDVELLIINFLLVLQLTKPKEYVTKLKYYDDRHRTYLWRASVDPCEHTSKHYYMVHHTTGDRLVLASNKKSAINFVARKHNYNIKELTAKKFHLNAPSENECLSLHPVVSKTSESNNED